jgi:hypothetical protein
MELRDDEQSATFVKELLERTPADPRRRGEPWAAIGQLGVDPAPPPKRAVEAAPPPPPDVEAE